MTETETLLTRVKNYRSHAEIGQCGDVLLRDCAATIEELCRDLTDAFCNLAVCQADGWWCTQSQPAALSLGDRLVKLGTWEIKPGGYARMQFYRPIEKK